MLLNPETDAKHLVNIKIYSKDNQLSETYPLYYVDTRDKIIKCVISIIDRFYNLDFYTRNSFNLFLNNIYLIPCTMANDWFSEPEVLESCTREEIIRIDDNTYFYFQINDEIKDY